MTNHSAPPDFLVSDIQLRVHAGEDDLLTAGLGIAGLRETVAPTFADPERPTAMELRRRAVWSNWRGIADLSPGGGFGEVFGFLQPVPGREYHALAKLSEANHPHRVMVQLPDTFHQGKRCIVVTASSGSRGIYGAIALAGAWGLAHGCAVAYTDKGGGTGYVDTRDGTGVKLDGTPATAGEPSEFSLPIYDGEGLAPIAMKHAHSGDNPEADWGRHVRQAAEFALHVLQLAHPEGGPYTFANTRVIAAGVSNGGGAVLRAAELDDDWLDGVVAVSPNIYPGEGGRPLYDYATEAALWMPCALNAGAFDGVALARPGGNKSPAGISRGASLFAAGELSSTTSDAQAEEAHRYMTARGWSDAAIAAGSFNTAFDVWRVAAFAYASAYARQGPDRMPCGCRFLLMDKSGVTHIASASERARWWSDGNGIPPAAGIGIVDSLAEGDDPSLPGLRCLRSLWQDPGEYADRVRAGVAATRASLPRIGVPLLIMHGVDDGLVPEAFSSGAYVQWCRTHDRDVRYWRVANVQHFDTFLGLPVLAARYLPMLPYAFHGLDAMWAHVFEAKPLPGDAEIATTPRQSGADGVAPLALRNLGTFPRSEHL